MRVIRVSNTFDNEMRVEVNDMIEILALRARTPHHTTYKLVLIVVVQSDTTRMIESGT